MLDLVITRDSLPIMVQPMDPPLLSDHTLMSRLILTAYDSVLTDQRVVRSWQSLDIIALTMDLGN